MSPLWRIFRRRLQMNIKKKFSRRKFVSSAVSASAISVLPGAQRLLHEFTAPIGAPGPEQNSVALTTNPAWRDQAILNLTKSPYAKLRNVPVHAVTIESGFWSPRRETNVNSSIPSMGKLLEVNGRMDNFRRLTGKSSAPQRGPVYSDSDIYKWIEAERPIAAACISRITRHRQNRVPYSSPLSLTMPGPTGSRLRCKSG